MKKKILLIISVVVFVMDILLVTLFWKNYMYYFGDVDMWTIGIFVGAAILIESMIIVIHFLKSQENLLLKVMISISALFMAITFTYKAYNDSVHYKLEYENIESIRSMDRDFNDEETKNFIELFNNAKYIKRNLSCEEEGTPDKTILVKLSDGEFVSLCTFGEQIAVHVTGRSYENSSYWMEQKEISEIISIK